MQSKIDKIKIKQLFIVFFIHTHIFTDTYYMLRFVVKKLKLNIIEATRERNHRLHSARIIVFLVW